MQGKRRLAVLAALILLSRAAEAQTFEELVEEALKRQRAAAGEAVPDETAPGEAQPLPPGVAAPILPPEGVAPAAPLPGAPAAPVFKPVELGPKPYTPPVLPTPPAGTAPSVAGSEAGPDGGAPPATPAAPEPGAVAMPQAPDIAPAVTVFPPGTERPRESLQAAEVNAATFSEEALAARGANPLILKAQILLDRAGASPGVIDGYAGGNLAKAVSAVESVLRFEADGELDLAVWKALRGDEAQDVLVQYTITEQDLSYPFAASIPEDYAEQARLPSLAYASPEEMLGERFHIDVRLLKALNPEADFKLAGSTIWVASVETHSVTGKVASIVADKARRQVRGYDGQNRLIVAYPATVGSTENPSPSGDYRIEAIAPNPVYHYPASGLTLAGDGEPLTLPPGPNSPVGSTLIGLSGAHCGIHGAPDPTTVGKTAPIGCVRLTNWDAEELAGMIEPGVVVSFVE
ncbi:MAG: L,D-transpeptidase family protein [Propylenella sp.]